MLQRISRTYKQQINALPEAVFPLLCPVREAEWVKGWHYRMIHSKSGVAELGCVFATPHHGEQETIWMVVDHEPPRYIRFVRVTPNETAVEITISVRRGGETSSEVDIRYTWTALSDRGEAQLATATEEDWMLMMKGWQDSMNQYLASL